jgi:DNA-binding response OmpR family regulator
MQCPCCGAHVAAPPLAEVVSRKLPPVQGGILRALAADFGQYVQTHRLAQRVWANDPEGGPVFADVCISQAIKRLKPVAANHGLVVEALRHHGYRVRAA